ncbi:MAG: HU family DNA-binding protein [bacterium]|nr:HU family DNA-binding protein [bacterium]MDT8395932.1 HU family DNA-binding protein [bacterium]
MNRTELIAKIAADAGISKAAAERALGAFVDSVTGALKKGGKVSLVGFGTFSVSERAARTGRNPRTGAVINIPASKVPKFKPGKGLKDDIR